MRLNVNLSDNMYDYVEKYSSQFGMSKSSFVTYCVGTIVMDLNTKYYVRDLIDLFS